MLSAPTAVFNCLPSLLSYLPRWCSFSLMSWSRISSLFLPVTSSLSSLASSVLRPSSPLRLVTLSSYLAYEREPGDIDKIKELSVVLFPFLLCLCCVVRSASGRNRDMFAASGSAVMVPVWPGSRSVPVPVPVTGVHITGTGTKNKFNKNPKKISSLMSLAFFTLICK